MDPTQYKFRHKQFILEKCLEIDQAQHLRLFQHVSCLGHNLSVQQVPAGQKIQELQQTAVSHRLQARHTHHAHHIVYRAWILLLA